jgi:hypothetical protein
MVATRRHPAGDFSEPNTTTTTSVSNPSAASPSKSTKTTNTEPNLLTSGYTHAAPYSLTLWLLASVPLVLWDTVYVLLRPHTMPGGRVHSPLWTPYALYGTIDYVYGWPAWRERSGFTAAQASLNALETVLYGWYVWVLWRRGTSARRGGRRTSSGSGGGQDLGDGGGDGGGGLGWFVGWSEEGRSKVVRGPKVGLAVVLAFAGAVMTFSKTLLYCECTPVFLSLSLSLSLCLLCSEAVYPEA